MAAVFNQFLKEDEDDITLYTAPVSNVGRSVQTILNIVAKDKYKVQNIDLFKGEQKQEEFT